MPSNTDTFRPSPDKAPKGASLLGTLSGAPFSGLKVAEAAGTPVAAATTNGDGLISSGGAYASGSCPPGQTEGENNRQAVRGLLTAFTRNSTPVGFTFKEPLIPNTEWVYAEYREARP